MARKSAKKGKAAKKVVKIGSIKKTFTKGQILNYLAERADVKRAQVASLMEGLNEIIESHLKKAGTGVFTLPGIAKFKVVRKPATKARKGINPFTGEPAVFKAKPARNVIKIRPLKKLKDMV